MPEAEHEIGTLFVSDPVTYRKMLEPFKDSEEADAALLAFSKELRDLRLKHKLPDVYVIVRASVRLGPEPDDEGVFILTTHNGADIHAEGMVAYAFGHEQGRRQEKIAKTASGKTIKTNRDRIGK